ncbi:hypothetical protein BOC58_16875 [Burkholderia pseudomallei]|nr:hypothetical protein BOC58_16875 [Burkholderia pseudomallei]
MWSGIPSLGRLWGGVIKSSPTQRLRGLEDAPEGAASPFSFRRLVHARVRAPPARRDERHKRRAVSGRAHLPILGGPAQLARVGSQARSLIIHGVSR